MNWKKTAALVLASVFILGGCSEKREQAQQMLAQAKEENRHEATTFAMDTIMTFTVYHENGEQIMTDAEQEIRRLERLLSVTIEDSEIAQLNANAGKQAVPVSEDTMYLLKTAKEMDELTNGCYDMTISPVVKAWGFTEEEHYVPTQAELDALMPLVDNDSVILSEEDQTAYLEKEGMAVDLGGIAKGYTSDAVTKLMKKEGVESALIWLGGNISAIGNKPDGNPWKIAVENPLNTEDYVGLVEVSDCSVITSGGYQRYFDQDGKRYHHIIDPATGYPSDSGLLSVTIISENGTKADALSTALFVMGYDRAVELWRQSDDFEAIFVTEDGKVIATEGIADQFTFEGKDNDFTYETVTR